MGGCCVITRGHWLSNRQRHFFRNNWLIIKDGHRNVGARIRHRLITITINRDDWDVKAQRIVFRCAIGMVYRFVQFEAVITLTVHTDLQHVDYAVVIERHATGVDVRFHTRLWVDFYGWLTKYHRFAHRFEVCGRIKDRYIDFDMVNIITAHRHGHRARAANDSVS